MELVLDVENNNYYFADILVSLSYSFENFKKVKNTIIFVEELEELSRLTGKITLEDVVVYVFSKEEIKELDLKNIDIIGNSYVFFIQNLEIIKKYKNYNKFSILYSSFLLAENLNEFLEEKKDFIKFYIPKIINNKNDIKFIF